jgi:hypothetical protein
MTIFYIDEAAEQELRALAERAAAKVIPLTSLIHAVEMMKAGTPIRLVPADQTIMLPTGFLVTYSVEEQPGGKMRHLSMSSPASGRAPIEAACEMVMEHLGFRTRMRSCQVWLEDLPDGEKAINILGPWLVH